MGARVFFEYFKLHAKTAMEYRMNFFAQSVFMMINNAVWLIVWFVLFTGLGEINGYQFADATIIFGVAALAIGLARVFFGKAEEIGEAIAEGRLDIFLGMPIDELFHMLISKSHPSAVGDALFGVLIFVIFVPDRILVGILVSIAGTLAYLSFLLLIQTIAFYFDRPFKLLRSLMSGIIAFSSWPIDVFNYSTRVWLYAIPVAFIAMVPYHLISSFDVIQLGLLFAVAFTLLLLAILSFKYGVHRYESGNLVVQRG